MRRRLRRVVAAGALAALVLGPVAAPADNTPDPRVRIAITRTSPDGVTATITRPAVAHVSPLLVVQNATGEPITIFDDTGAPFLRASGGVVEGNTRSAFLGPAIAPNAPGSPSPGGPEPLWRRLGTGSTLRWYDARASYTGHGPDDPSKAAVLKPFTIAGTLGDEALTIQGEVTWMPITGRTEPVVESIRPDDDGIEVRVAPGPLPAIQLSNASARTIQITGPDGRPFGRIGPGGVEVNANSPTWRDTRSLPPVTAATPDWQKQNTVILVWLERRAAYDEEVPAAIVASGKPATVARWTIPGTIDGAPFEIRGSTRWVPAEVPGAAAPRSRTLPWPWIAAGVTAVTAAAVVALRRRRA